MDHTRHIDIYDVSRVTVDLIGAGGIGATTAMALAKMGVMTLDLYDMDYVGTENLATQLHKLSDVGSSKTEAITRALEEYANDVYITSHCEKVDANTIFHAEFVICAVDNIQTRKEVCKSITENTTKSSFFSRYFLDARMSAEEFHLYAVDLMDGDARRKYQAMIDQESDESIPELACTRKATIFCAFMAAGHVSNAVKKLAMGEGHPFSLVHNIKTFTFLAG
ncbi:MAG: ThiF family adenylyltransferase [Anaerolineaceae bacterium]